MWFETGNSELQNNLRFRMQIYEVLDFGKSPKSDKKKLSFFIKKTRPLFWRLRNVPDFSRKIRKKNWLFRNKIKLEQSRCFWTFLETSRFFRMFPEKSGTSRSLQKTVEIFEKNETFFWRFLTFAKIQNFVTSAS